MINFDYYNSLTSCVENIESFFVFKNREQKSILVEDKNFNNLKEGVKQLFSLARVMPAFGVSLDYETQNELKQGEWLQVNFSFEENANGLLFNSLLFKLDTVSGFNLIRLHNGKYEGRCIYLDFDDILDLKQILNISWQNVIIDLKLITVKNKSL